MLDVADRRVDGFSKGMRQRTKVAAALVTDPHVLVLDEPLERRRPGAAGRTSSPCSARSAQQGRTVIVSSHVLNEVERLAERLIVLIHGRLAAAGGHHAIRDAMDDRPRTCPRPLDQPAAPLAAALLALDSVGGVTFDASSLVVAIQPRSRRGDRAPAARTIARRPARRGTPARRLAREPVPGAGP